MRIPWLVHTLVGVPLLLIVTATGGAAPGTARYAPVPTSISFWNARDGAAALIDWGTCSGRRYFCKGAIAVTNDGGHSWTMRWRGAAVRSITVVRGTRDAWAAVEPQEACGTRLASPCPTRLMHSRDGGRTWQPSAQHLVDPSFGAQNVGFAVRARPGDVEMGPVMRTTDGGRTWQRVGGPCVGATGTSISFGSARHGWLLCTSQPGPVCSRRPSSRPGMEAGAGASSPTRTSPGGAEAVAASVRAAIRTASASSRADTGSSGKRAVTRIRRGTEDATGGP
jgi:photosystem II stability/assembly factor-like uncharacterized protein